MEAGANSQDRNIGAAPAALDSDELETFPNEAGKAGTYSTAGAIDTENAFFQSLGSNGRACVTCHVPSDGFTITPATVQSLFERCEEGGRKPRTKGRRPESTACAIFRAIDGANRPDADLSSSQARRDAYSLLLSKGLIRIEQTVPANAEFELIDVDSPYHDDAEEDALVASQTLFLYRRPLPSTNLRFALDGVMWDLRETSTGPITPPSFLPNPPKSLVEQLITQARSATDRHAQGALSDVQAAAIVDFELSLFSAQIVTRGAGNLTSGGALGGPRHLAEMPAPVQNENALGITPFTRTVFTLFDAWADLPDSPRNALRRSIARGQDLFNHKVAAPVVQVGTPFFNQEGTTCSDCHTALETGTNNVLAPLNQVRVSAAEFRTPDMPLFTLRCKTSAFCTTGQTLQTTDPGRGLITGQWRLLERFKVPSMRNLVARAPYFHNGLAATLEEVMDLYEESMDFQFTAEEKQDIVNFMKAL